MIQVCLIRVGKWFSRTRNEEPHVAKAHLYRPADPNPAPGVSSTLHMLNVSTRGSYTEDGTFFLQPVDFTAARVTLTADDSQLVGFVCCDRLSCLKRCSKMRLFWNWS